MPLKFPSILLLLTFASTLFGQHVGVNVFNPQKDLHLRNTGNEVAVRLDATKSSSGFNFLTALASPTGVSNVDFNGNQDWTDLDYTKLLNSDDSRLTGPEVSQFLGGTDILKVQLDFPSIPNNAIVTDVTLRVEWSRSGPSGQVINVLNTYLQQVSTDTFLYDFGLQNITSDVDQQFQASYQNEFIPLTPAIINADDIYLSFYPMETYFSPDGSMMPQIDQLAVELEYKVPATGSENVSWTSGIREGQYILASGIDLNNNNVMAIDENGLVQVRGLRIPKNAGPGKVLTSNEQGRAFWSDLPSTLVTSINDLSDAVSSSSNVYLGSLAGMEGDTGSFNTAVGIISQRDGIHSNNNTSLGYASLANNTNGNRNTAIGTDALTNSTLASDNVALGFKALGNNDLGLKNMAIGNSALRFNVDGDDNIGIGDNALYNTKSNENLAIGKEAMYFNVGGQRNTAVGFRSMFFANDDPTLLNFDNTALGYESMRGSDTPADNVGKVNTSVGFQSMYQLSAGNFNTALGAQSLYNNTSHSANTAIGYRSMYYAYNGAGFISTNNTAVGAYALEGGTDASMNSGYRNVAVGVNSLNSNTSGDNNVGLGMDALEANTEGGDNIGIGYRSMYLNTSGSDNVSVGSFAMNDNTTGGLNVGIGTFALSNNTDGNFNTALGANALLDQTGGVSNTGVGANALENAANTSNNTGVGRGAGSSMIAGTDNTFIGASAGGSGTGFTTNQVTILGAASILNTSRTNVTALGFGVSSSVLSADDIVAIGNTAVTEVRANVASFTTYSDARIKYNISKDVKGLDFINRLEPVVYNQDPGKLYDIWGHHEDEALGIDHSAFNQKQLIGFLAQDVEAAARASGWTFPGVNPPKNEQEVYTIRYTDFIMPMTKAIQELSEENTQLKAENEELRALIQSFESRLSALEDKSG
jgi:hypothetical protein